MLRAKEKRFEIERKINKTNENRNYAREYIFQATINNVQRQQQSNGGRNFPQKI